MFCFMDHGCGAVLVLVISLGRRCLVVVLLDARLDLTSRFAWGEWALDRPCLQEVNQHVPQGQVGLRARRSERFHRSVRCLDLQHDLWYNARRFAAG